MSSNAVRVARHRRGLRVGISLSAAAHVAALAWVTLPGAPPPDPASASQAVAPVERPTSELELVRLASTKPSPAPAPAPQPARTASAAPEQGAAVSASATAEAPSLDAFLARLTVAAHTPDGSDASRPLTTFKRLKPVAGSGTGTEAGATEEEDDREGGLWSGLLDAVTLSVGGGPYCPVRGGPLIMR